jgi:hypothetical protein
MIKRADFGSDALGFRVVRMLLIGLKMKRTEKLVPFMAVFEIVFLAGMFGLGCDGEDPVQQDAGTDGTPVQTDSGTDSDGTVNPTDSGSEAPVVNCDDYRQYGQGWSCYAPPDGIPFDCDFTTLTDSGNCLINCPGHFSCVVPPELSTYQQFTCQVYGSQTTRTCAH